ncbi:MAG: tetratricopeptide repeat-containing sulfotransferase family protein, partial [Alphaproteobacteria bacterium]
IRLGPEDAQAHATMGMILTDGNRNKPGEHHYRQAIKFTKDNPRLLANLAQNLKSQGRLEEAEDCFRRALEGEPKNVQTLLGWAKMEESRRNFEKAWELTDQAADLAPDLPTVVIQRATLFSREKKHEDALEVLERFSAERADSAATDQGDVPGLLMEKGQVLDRLGRYDDAFLAFSEAKKRLRETSGTQYMAQAAQEQAARLKAFFVRGRMSLLTPARKAEGRVQPLFITGFPRSGTTMTEQILSAHPNISAGDELPFLGDMTRFTQRMLGAPLAYPEALADLWMGDNQGAAELLRDHYLLKVDQLEIVEDGTDWFTDKMPLNEWQMGLMALLFPESPVVHLQRHPLDQVLSCFSNFLTHGFYCAYDLVTAAQHVALTADLVEHFVDELPLKHKIVRYEDIVSDQETHVRALLEFVDEPFDERCLNFHENKRFARTASYAQVTEPLYTGSRFRYRNYRKQLEPALAVLEPTIRRLGYPVD